MSRNTIGNRDNGKVPRDIVVVLDEMKLLATIEDRARPQT